MSEIGHGVAIALESLHEEIAFWGRQMELHKGNVHMERNIALFQFLGYVSQKWEKSSFGRSKHGFN
jgi:hypothetical protein